MDKVHGLKYTDDKDLEKLFFLCKNSIEDIVLITHSIQGLTIKSNTKEYTQSLLDTTSYNLQILSNRLNN